VQGDCDAETATENLSVRKLIILLTRDAMQIAKPQGIPVLSFKLQNFPTNEKNPETGKG